MATEHLIIIFFVNCVVIGCMVVGTVSVATLCSIHMLLLILTFIIQFQCKQTAMEPGDGLDNDCDGKIDEEVRDGKDNDGDRSVDEDLELVRK